MRRAFFAKPALERGWEEDGCYSVGFVWIFCFGFLYAKLGMPGWVALGLAVPLSVAVCTLIVVSVWVLLVLFTFVVKRFTK
jgi:hypothetical protein